MHLVLELVCVIRVKLNLAHFLLGHNDLAPDITGVARVGKPRTQ